MSFDFEKMFDYTKNIVTSAPNVRSGMFQLLDYCETNSPNPVWANIRQLDFEGDVERLRAWLEKVLSSEPPTEKINAFWFGLFNPVLENGEVSAGLYLSGSTKFDPDDETGDWAVEDDDSYLPEARYANSQVLKEIYRLISKTEVANIGEYVLCLGFAGLATKVMCQLVNRKFLLGERKKRDIAVGFDSGDFIILDGIEK
ncbi:MAG: hypothetical protein ACOYZ8_04915 [Chloroflexota bacterium]